MKNSEKRIKEIKFILKREIFSFFYQKNKSRYLSLYIDNFQKPQNQFDFFQKKVKKQKKKNQKKNKKKI